MPGPPRQASGTRRFLAPERELGGPGQAAPSIFFPQSSKAGCLFQRTEETLKKERRLLKQRTQALRYGSAVLRDRKLLKCSEKNLITELSGSGMVLLPAGWRGRRQPYSSSLRFLQSRAYLPY